LHEAKNFKVGPGFTFGRDHQKWVQDWEAFACERVRGSRTQLRARDVLLFSVLNVYWKGFADIAYSSMTTLRKLTPFFCSS